MSSFIASGCDKFTARRWECTVSGNMVKVPNSKYKVFKDGFMTRSQLLFVDVIPQQALRVRRVSKGPALRVCPREMPDRTTLTSSRPTRSQTRSPDLTRHKQSSTKPHTTTHNQTILHCRSVFSSGVVDGGATQSGHTRWLGPNRC